MRVVPMSDVMFEGENRRALPVLYLLGHGQECLLDIGRILCRRLEEWDSKLIGKLLRCMV